jgi:hypothetical protein
MRGSISLVVRKGGKVKISQSDVRVITKLFNPALFIRRQKHVSTLIANVPCRKPDRGRPRWQNSAR